MSKKTTAPAKSGDTVAIACKLPHGLEMRIYDMQKGSEPVMGGGFRDTQVPVQVGESITIHGNATPFGQMPKCPIVGGYAITQGIPAEFAEKWFEQNETQDMVKNNLVLYADKVSKLEGAAAELADTKSGLQPLQLDAKGQVNDPRAGKKVQTADEQPKPGRAPAEAQAEA